MALPDKPNRLPPNRGDMPKVEKPAWPEGGDGSAPPPDGAEDAFAYLQSILSTYGLGSLADWAWQQILDGRSANEVMQSLRDTEEYKERFRAIELLRANGYPAISESEVIAWERQAREVMMAAGMPAGFYDSYTDFADIIGTGQSINEFTTRVNDGFLAVASAPAEVRQMFQSWFGPDSDTAMAALFLDPDRALPVLQRQVQMAQIGGSAFRFGFDVTQGRAEDLARLGVTGDAANQGWQQLSQIRGAFQERIGEDEDLTPEEHGADLLFDAGRGGEKVDRRLEQRKAALSGSAGGGVTRRGGVGLGTGSNV